MKNLFYANITNPGEAYLNESESHHCIQVLRMKKGEKVFFIDGAGGYGEGILTEDNPKRCRISIEELTLNFGKREYSLHLGIAPTKSSDRFEYFLEKATEIGIDRITPLLCDHSERKKLRNDRLERILLSAAKQSGKAFLPVLDEMTGFETFIKSLTKRSNRFIAHCRDDSTPYLLHKVHPDSHVLILIGPEGDFSEKEIGRAEAEGFLAVSLGESRLRTETAGVVAAQVVADSCVLKKKGK